MSRNYSIDFFKCLAIFAVVCIHTHTFRDTAVPFGDGETWDYIINTLSRFCVPFFFAASGYLFSLKLRSSNQTFAYFKKYIFNLISLLAVWFSFYWIYDFTLLMTKSYDSLAARKAEAMTYIQDTIQWSTLIDGVSHTQYQLWFMFGLIFAIIIVYTAYRLRMLKILLFASLILNLVGLLGQSYGGLFGLPELEQTTRNGLYFGLFYTTLGCMAGMKEAQLIDYLSKKKTYMLAAAVIFLSGLQLLERTLLHYSFGQKLGEYFISTIPLTVALLLLVIKKRDIGKHPIFTNLAKNVVGIYLVHTFLKSVINQVMEYYDPSVMSTFIWGALYAPALYVLSYLVYLLLQFTKRKLTSEPVAKQKPSYTKPRKVLKPIDR